MILVFGVCNSEQDDDGNYIWQQDFDEDGVFDARTEDGVCVGEHGSECPGIDYPAMEDDGASMNSYAPYAYDAVFMIAHALHELIEVDGKDTIVGEELHDKLLTIDDYVGATGPIEFETSSADYDWVNQVIARLVQSMRSATTTRTTQPSLAPVSGRQQAIAETRQLVNMRHASFPVTLTRATARTGFGQPTTLSGKTLSRVLLQLTRSLSILRPNTVLRLILSPVLLPTPMVTVSPRAMTASASVTHVTTPGQRERGPLLKTPSTQPARPPMVNS